MTVVPTPEITAPEPRGLRYGLLSAAAGPLDLPVQGGRGGGVQYQPVSCGAARIYPLECPEGEPTEKVYDPHDPLVTAAPFMAYATYRCGSAGHPPGTIEAHVRRRLHNGEQAAVEQALGAELATQATGPIAGGSTFVATIGALEQWLYGSDGAAYGSIGYLHSPLRYAAYAAEAGLTVRDGPILRTHLGTVWIFGDYPDTGRLYASGAVTVWRSPDVFIPTRAQVLDRATNQLHMLAEREYAVAWDCVAGYSDLDEAVPS